MSKEMIDNVGLTVFLGTYYFTV